MSGGGDKIIMYNKSTKSPIRVYLPRPFLLVQASKENTPITRTPDQTSLGMILPKAQTLFFLKWR